jgi:hypothetical protein
VQVRVPRRVAPHIDAGSGCLKVGRGSLAGAIFGRNLVAQLLTFPDFGEAGFLDGGGVHEYIRAACGRLDEAEASTVIEKLYGTCGHIGLL